jgi:hypothetical protein
MQMGHLYQRTIKGGWEKVEEVSYEKFLKYHVNQVHKVGQYKGQPMFRFRLN